MYICSRNKQRKKMLLSITNCKRKAVFAATVLIAMAGNAQTNLSTLDLNAPFGWTNCSSMTAGDDYSTTGGEGSSQKRTITLKSTGADMKSAIQNAVKNNDIIILDGSDGDFIVSSNVGISGAQNKTIVGINGARICSKWYVTPEIIKMLDDNNVKSYSTSSGTGSKLTNGTNVSEGREYITRQLLINYTGDSSEGYRSSGILSISGCNNLIIRNLKFVGPGTVDISGNDLISCTGTTHLWVDHCDFTDGLDGNFDITNGSNFVTVSWCSFSYTDRAYDHRNTNLVGSSDSYTSDEDNLNITYAFNNWGTKCNARMPMARFGTIHMLNNYYDCEGNGSPCINPRKNSEFLIEGNYFDSGVRNIFSQSSAKRWTWTSTNYTVESFSPSSSGTNVTMPYSYTVANVQNVPTEIKKYVGATLENPLVFGKSGETSVSKTVKKQNAERIYTPDGSKHKKAQEGVNIIVGEDGNVKKVLR